MSLSRNEVNPLNVLGLRKLTFIPQHFGKIAISVERSIPLLDNWISYYLNSRYAIKKSYTLDHNNRMIEVLEIGIEDPRELTMLTLGCPYLHNNKELIK